MRTRPIPVIVLSNICLIYGYVILGTYIISYFQDGYVLNGIMYGVVIPLLLLITVVLAILALVFRRNRNILFGLHLTIAICALLVIICLVGQEIYYAIEESKPLEEHEMRCFSNALTLGAAIIPISIIQSFVVMLSSIDTFKTRPLN